MKNQFPRSGIFHAIASLALILLYVCSSAAATEKILHNFSILPHGANSEANLTADAAGNLYGTTYDGGGYGVVFKLTPTSGGKWTESVIHDFVGEPSSGPDGAYPAASLIFDASGNLYGTTSQGGTYGQGTVFKLTPTSGGNWKETVVHEFEGYPGDGSSPVASLIFDKAGNLYGTTEYGGNNDGCGDQYFNEACGTIFELAPTSDGGWTETVIHNFQGGTDGCVPMDNLVFDAAGNLYGSTLSNGAYGYSCDGQGTVFELSPGSGGSWTESILYDFNNTHWYFPSGVIFDKAGNLYGTAADGDGQAIVFELTLQQGIWTESTLYNFTGGPDGGTPSGNLVLDSAGNLYGTTAYGGITSACNNQGCGTAFELSPGSGGWTEKVLYSFTGKSDGANPEGGLLRVSASTVYVTASSGANPGCYFGNSSDPSSCGAVLKLTASSNGNWTAGVVYDFPSPQDGSSSYANLISDAAGNLYGTTEFGGTGQCYTFPHQGCGTIFELSPTSTGEWKKKILYSFTGSNGDGFGPMGGVVFDEAGNLYGTTQSGGSLAGGTVFELSPSRNGHWTETVIHPFGGGDGYQPVAGLVFGKEGILYGTTLSGGSSNYGVAFELVPRSKGWTESVLYSFGGGGAYPRAGLLLDKEGNLYGTTQSGGGSSSSGAVFKLTRSNNEWSESVLYSFNRTGGWYPMSSLIFDQDGNLYGTTQQGGVYDAGVVFELTPGAGGAWSETVLHNFVGVNGDGAAPVSNVIFDNSGNLYGTTTVGGTDGGNCGGLGCGTAFELTPEAEGKWKERVLHRFTGGLDGGQPYAGFILDPTGNLYATTSSGGIADQGTVFEITP